MHRYTDLIKVAKMYYVKRLPLRKIAAALQVSVPTVSRMLHEAERAGLIKFEVLDIHKRNRDLECKLRETFGLVEAFVVTVNHLGQINLKEFLGMNSVQVVKKYLRPGALVGIGPGETIANLVKFFPNDYLLSDITIIPLMGGWGLEGVEYDNNKLVTELSSLLHCNYFLLPAPAYVSNSSIRENLIAEPLVKPVVDLWKSLDVAIFSIGPEIKFARFKEVIKDQVEKTRELQVVGDILGHLINMLGDPVDMPFNKQLISIPLDDLKKIPWKITIAGGRLKYKALLAALRSGFVTVLVTDEITATQLLNEGGD